MRAYFREPTFHLFALLKLPFNTGNLYLEHYYHSTSKFHSGDHISGQLTALLASCSSEMTSINFNPVTRERFITGAEKPFSGLS